MKYILGYVKANIRKANYLWLLDFSTFCSLFAYIYVNIDTKPDTWTNEN